MTRLDKRDVERLLDSYDRDPVAALSVALEKVLDLAGAAWPQLVYAAGLDPARTERLLAAQPNALDELATELNEQRELNPR